jgi:hypothetical protein
MEQNCAAICILANLQFKMILSSEISYIQARVFIKLITKLVVYHQNLGVRFNSKHLNSGIKYITEKRNN